MEIIVLHDRYNNEPIIIRVSAINAIQKRLDIIDDNNKEEYTGIVIGYTNYDVKEPIDVVMRRIKAVIYKEEKERKNMMTLEEAIEYYEESVLAAEKMAKEYHECEVRKCELIPFAEMDYTRENEYRETAEEYRQLAEWLKELKKFREKDRYNNWDICLGGFHKD